MRYEKLTKNSKYLDKAKEIYFSSFPEYERADFGDLLDGKFDDEIFLWFDGKELIGLSCVCLYSNLTYLFYLAVVKEKRNHGYGSQILKEVTKMFPRNCFALSIEFPVKNAERYEDKIRRKNFYLKNGFKDSHFLFDFFGEPFLPLYMGEFDKKSFSELMIKFFGSDCDNFRDI